MYIYPLWKIPDPGWKFIENGCKGIIVENVVHAIDNLRYLMGDIKRIYAEGDTFIFSQKLPDSTRIRSVEEFGMTIESREAASFAVIGYLTLNGKPGNLNSATGAKKRVPLGKISYPS